MNDDRVVSAKLSREEFNNFKSLCERKGQSFNILIKKLINREITAPFKEHKSGENILKYDARGDHFSWIIKLDEGRDVEILENLSFEFVNDLKEKINLVEKEREAYLGKTKKESVRVPGKLVGKEI
jgi:hypothetical protein